MRVRLRGLLMMAVPSGTQPRHGRGQVWAALGVRMKGLPMVAVPLVALSALTLSVHVFQSERRQAEENWYQTVQLHREVQALHADLLSGESAIRIYMLQGQDELLEPYRSVRRSLPPSNYSV